MGRTVITTTKKDYFRGKRMFVDVWNESNDWRTQKSCPVRMVGIAELRTGDIPDKWRKRMDTAIRRGYALENRTVLPTFLDIFCNSVTPVIPIGYVGKQDGSVWISDDDYEDAKKAVVSWYMMTGEAVEAHLQTRKSDYVQSYIHGRTHAAPGELIRFDAEFPAPSQGGDEAPHLRSASKGFRKAMEPYLAKWAREREKLADALQRDDYTVRIPFDSHIERSKS